MKYIALTAFFAASLSQAATLVTSETTPFTPLGANTNEFSTNSEGETTFFNDANQGSGIVLDPSSAPDGNPFTTTGPTYFSFSSRVGTTPLEVFFGAVSDTPNSADGINPNSTAFSLGISPSGVDYLSQGSPTDLLTPAADYAPGTKLNFEVVVTPVEINPGQFSFDYDVIATEDGTSNTASATGIRANQNPQSATAIADYTFNGIGTRNSTGGAVSPNTLGPVLISDMPIAVPEPSHLMLSCVALMALGARRKRS